MNTLYDMGGAIVAVNELICCVEFEVGECNRVVLVSGWVWECVCACVCICWVEYVWDARVCVEWRVGREWNWGDVSQWD